MHLACTSVNCHCQCASEPVLCHTNTLPACRRTQRGCTRAAGATTFSTSCTRLLANGSVPWRPPRPTTGSTCAPPTTATPSTWRPWGTATWPSSSTHPPPFPRGSVVFQLVHSAGAQRNSLSLSFTRCLAATRSPTPTGLRFPGCSWRTCCLWKST